MYRQQLGLRGGLQNRLPSGAAQEALPWRQNLQPVRVLRADLLLTAGANQASAVTARAPARLSDGNTAPWGRGCRCTVPIKPIDAVIAGRPGLYLLLVT